MKGTNDAAGQTNAMLDYIGAKVDAIIVDPIDSAAIVTAVKAANKAGIPVIAVQSNVNGGKTATFIAGREDSGREMAKDAVNYCKGKNPCEIGIVEGIRADQSGAEENKAFRAYVGKARTSRSSARPNEYDPVKALNVATNLLTAHPGIDYIYAWWDPGALAAVQGGEVEGSCRQDRRRRSDGDCIKLGHVIKGNIQHETTFFPRRWAADGAGRGECDKGPEAAGDHGGADPRRDDEVRERPAVGQGEAAGRGRDHRRS